MKISRPETTASRSVTKLTSTHDNFRLPPIEYVAIDAIKHYGRKLRKRSPKAQQQLAESIARLKISRPIVIEPDGTIIDGHAVFEAAVELGHRSVPVIRVEHLNSDERKVLRIALNKQSELGEWTAELSKDLADLRGVNLDFSLSLTGFDEPQIDNLILGDLRGQIDEAPPELPIGPAISRVGDVWRLGQHRVMCGSSTDSASLSVLMAGERARMVCNDMPYNVKIKGHVSGLGRVKHREFVEGSGEKSRSEFTEFVTKSICASTAICVDGGLQYLFMDWRHMGEMLAAIEINNLTLINVAVWVKSAGSMGSFYRSQHELIFIATNDAAPFRNNVQLGRFGRNRTNCFFYPGMNSFSRDRDERLASHPTPKNVELIAEIIRDASDRGEIVFDGFLGSGTTLIAAERTGRRCFGADLDPLYVDGVVRRWHQLEGKEAVLESTGQTFAEVTLARTQPSVLVNPRPRTRAA